MPTPIRIVYLDRDLVVAEKPAGLATVRYHGPDAPLGRAGGEPPVLAELLPPLIRRQEGARAQKGKPRPLRVVQRLDIGTSGLVVFARTAQAERELGTQFRKHSVQRSYLAVVLGDFSKSRRIDSLLVEDRGDGLRGSHSARGKRAVTHVKPLERFGGEVTPPRHLTTNQGKKTQNMSLVQGPVWWSGATPPRMRGGEIPATPSSGSPGGTNVYTSVECRLETGRTHQIRIHLAEAGHPLCGETVYNRPRFGEAVPDPSGAPRIMLHAGELGFAHPRSGQRLHFTQAPPEDFQDFLDLVSQKG